eukprot:GILK01003236.1.p1 GENE.GILK01003236.1~~GILK01003236.1.p1  ORF type:complete len:1259 (+),score=240.27 GILK01003236.1:51-3779(+)
MEQSPISKLPLLKEGNKSVGIDIPHEEKKEEEDGPPKTVLRRRSTLKSDPHFRTIELNDSVANAQHRFCWNYVRTAKYTVFTFIPKNLFEQFMRVANCYFLAITVLSCFSFSPMKPTTMITGLTFVLMVTAVKEALEDKERHRMDREINNRKVEVLRDGHSQALRWIDVQVGDIVKVKDHEYFPADLLFLSSSDEGGLCYVETANLDGETNLKIKLAVHHTANMNEEQLMRLRGKLEGEEPNNRLHSYQGSLTFEAGLDHRRPSEVQRRGGKTVPISLQQMLLRGTQLRDTQWVLGMAVFTGNDTKQVRNSTEAPHKRSQVEVKMNQQLIWILTVQICVSVCCSALNTIWSLKTLDDMWYLQETQTSSASGIGVDSITKFLTYMILFNAMIPLSLYVSVEMVRWFQSLYINWDVEMYHEASNTPAVARTSNINEELGRVKFVFSDKTGTLTENRMLFVGCSVAGREYGKAVTGLFDRVDEADEEEESPRKPSPDRSPMQAMEILSPNSRQVKSAKPPAIDIEGAEKLNTNLVAPKPGAHLLKQGVEGFEDERFEQDLKSGGERGKAVFEFLEALSLCHTVIPEEKEDGEIAYHAASPDESALLNGAKELGFVFRCRTPDNCAVVDMNGEQKTYQILNVIEFTSDRKRMSVIVRTPDNKIKLLCKGADSIILERLKQGHQKHKEKTLEHLGVFASGGLRTLCIANVILEENKWRDWNEKFEAAGVVLVDREKKLSEVAEMIEKDLELVGATAIEDKLQDGVPETLAALMDAEIGVWVLTGDKQETAINIALSCSLLDADMHLFVLNEKSRSATMDSLEKYLQNASKYDEKALIVDGPTLTYALDAELKLSFFNLAKQCSSVICCRVSPLQKALVVKLVREFEPESITLAIGDGANDVPMIQAAHVGVGISGNEGMQAVLSSDFSVARFSYLRRLIFVHGYWNFKRVTKLILYSFYKNMAVSLGQLWFSFYDYSSGQTIFDDVIYTLFNLCFTAFPIMALAVFNRDVTDETLIQNPDVYKFHMRNYTFKKRIFWSWILLGVYQSAVIFYFPFFSMNDIGGSDGKDLGMWGLGTAAFTFGVITVTFQLVMINSTWTMWNHFLVWGSLIWFVGFMFSYCSLSTFAPNMFDVFYELFACPAFWLNLVLVPVACTLPQFVFKSAKHMFFPSASHVVREKEFLNKRKRARSTLIQRVLRPLFKLYTSGNKASTHTGFAFSQDTGESRRLGKRNTSFGPLDAAEFEKYRS